MSIRVLALRAELGTEVDRLVELLQASLAQTLATLSALSDAELDEHSDHACAMGGSVRDLLTHNIDHERMHTGQVYSARCSLKHMQKGEVDRLRAETLRARIVEVPVSHYPRLAGRSKVSGTLRGSARIRSVGCVGAKPARGRRVSIGAPRPT